MCSITEFILYNSIKTVMKGRRDVLVGQVLLNKHGNLSLVPVVHAKVYICGGLHCNGSAGKTDMRTRGIHWPP